MRGPTRTRACSLAAAVLAVFLLLLPVAALSPLHALPPPVCALSDAPLSQPAPPPPPPPTYASEPDLLSLVAAARRDLAAARRAVGALARGAVGASRARAAGAAAAAARGASMAARGGAVRGMKAAAEVKAAAKAGRAGVAGRVGEAQRQGIKWAAEAGSRVAAAKRAAGIVAGQAGEQARRRRAHAMAGARQYSVIASEAVARGGKAMVETGGAVGCAVGVAVAAAATRTNELAQRGGGIARAVARRAATEVPRLQVAVEASLPWLGKAAFACVCIVAGVALLATVMATLLEEKIAEPLGLALYALMRAQITSLRKQKHNDHQLGTAGVTSEDWRAAAALLLAEADDGTMGAGDKAHADSVVEASASLAASALPKAPHTGQAAAQPSRPRKPRPALVERGSGDANPSYNERRQRPNKTPSAARRKQPIRVRYADPAKPSLTATDTRVAQAPKSQIPAPERNNLYVTERRGQPKFETKIPEVEVIILDD